MGKNLIVAHGDVDGVITGALIIIKHGLNLSETDVVFTQPFLVDKINPERYESVYVADIAVNNRDPDMTRRFVENVGNRLKVWYDHHQGWGSEIVDKRFIINESAPSCAMMIGGDPKWVEAANAIDSRKGESQLGQLLDQAMKVNLSDDAVRQVALRYILGMNDGEILRQKQQEYRTIEAKTKELVELGKIEGKVLLIDARGHTGFDRTQIFITGYTRAPFVCVIDELEGKITTTTATNTKTNLLEVFGLKSGAPFRVTLEGDQAQLVIQRLSQTQ